MFLKVYIGYVYGLKKADQVEFLSIADSSCCPVAGYLVRTDIRRIGVPYVV